jgi:hypothetical protein
MTYPSKSNIPYEEIENGALILLLLKECKTWDELCRRFAYADPADIKQNTNSMSLHRKLLQMRDQGLLDLELLGEGSDQTIGQIKATDLWSKIRVAFGGMSLSEAAMLSRHAKGMAVAPVFGRPQAPGEKADVFVVMPFKPKLEKVYTEHIKKLGDKLGVVIRRANDSFAPKPFMDKVWDGINAARLIIADCTEKNPNVFYEIGMAHTVGKPVVLITRSQKDIPSDVQHIDYIEYVYDPEGVGVLLEKLSSVIRRELKLEKEEEEGEKC